MNLPWHSTRWRFFVAVRGVSVATIAALLTAGGGAAHAAPDEGADPVRISGSGSTWAQNAVESWRATLAADGVNVDYTGNGAPAGRAQFAAGTTDFAISEQSFESASAEDPAAVVPTGSAAVPLVAGATVLAYRLDDANGTRVTDLRLSSDVIARIFTGAITRWDDPAVRADNPDLALPDEPITPVVRSDASGSTAQFTEWMSTQQPTIWTTGVTSIFPTPAGGVASPGSHGVAGYIGQAYGRGAIGYVENSYALEGGLTVAKVRNHGDYYIGPTAAAVGIALLAARADAAGTPMMSDVYANTDPRAYPISGYASMFVPTADRRPTLPAAEGAMLGAFASHAVCAGQHEIADAGYAPLPVTLVELAAAGIARIPGADQLDLAGCANPTFQPGDTTATNSLLRDSPMPPEADRYLPEPDVHEDDLIGALQTLTITATPGSSVLTVGAGAPGAGRTLMAGVFPGPHALGLVALNGAGTGTVNTSSLMPGAVQSLYLADGSGTVVAWNSFIVPDPSTGPVEPEPPASGRFELIAPSSGTLDWGAVQRDVVSAAQRLGAFTVIDDRAEHTGWTLQVDVEDFTHSGRSETRVSKRALGFAAVASTLPEGIAVSAQPQVAGSGEYSAIVASGEPGSKTGPDGVTMDADLTLLMPADAVPGIYRSTLTLTLTAP